MTFLRIAAVAAWTLSVPVTHALDCARASTPIEKTICRETDLQAMDNDLQRLYFGLRSQVTVKARGDLLSQQRAWLAERDRVCATGEAGCLRGRYRNRIDELKAIQATAEVSDEPLKDVRPVLVRGKWTVASVKDPAGTNAQISLKESLADAGLPAIGASIDAEPGKLCVPPTACRTLGWTVDRLLEVDAGDAIERVFGLHPGNRVFVGTSGSIRSYYLLVPQSDGTLWAVFDLCGAHASDCRKAAEVWTPASPDAMFSPR